MHEDFLDAHQRHLDDADRLFQARRWANADHLYGMAAECGLKALIQKLKNSALDNKDRLHVMEENKPNNVWLRYQSYLSGHGSATRLSLPQNNPFSDWSVSQRYARQSCFDQRRAQAHRDGARTVENLVRIARQEGLL